MTNATDGQGELFGQRAKRSRIADPARRPGEPTKAATPGRTGAQFVAPPATAAQAETRRQLTDRLELIALKVGADFGPKGFALYHVRTVAEIDGVLTGDESAGNPRALSWLGALLPSMARKGLVEKLVIDGRPQYDTSQLEHAHGNKNVLWTITALGRNALASTQVRDVIRDATDDGSDGNGARMANVEKFGAAGLEMPAVRRGTKPPAE